jgi:hypothetical protein
MDKIVRLMPPSCEQKVLHQAQGMPYSSNESDRWDLALAQPAQVDFVVSWAILSACSSASLFVNDGFDKKEIRS